jgi:hypothetical protein
VPRHTGHGRSSERCLLPIGVDFWGGERTDEVCDLSVIGEEDGGNGDRVIVGCGSIFGTSNSASSASKSSGPHDILNFDMLLRRFSGGYVSTSASGAVGDPSPGGIGAIVLCAGCRDGTDSPKECETAVGLCLARTMSVTALTLASQSSVIAVMAGRCGLPLVFFVLPTAVMSWHHVEDRVLQTFRYFVDFHRQRTISLLWLPFL